MTQRRDTKGRFAPQPKPASVARVDTGSRPKIRTDALTEARAKTAAYFQGDQFAFGSGWLYPAAAWATYMQNGVVRQVINRAATTMLSKGWYYKGEDVSFDWSSVQSELENLHFARALRSCVTWQMIFGGAGIVIIPDDADRPWSEPLVRANVRKIVRLEARTCLTLKPATGNWATCTHFVDQHEANPARRSIHRSRVLTIVGHDVPTDLGRWGAQVLNIYTGWPPSWIEGIYTALCEWNDAEKNTATILRTMSLLSLKLRGFRKAHTSPDSQERVELESTLEAIAENLDNEGLLTIDVEDELDEVGRNTTGLSDLLEAKKKTFVASTGAPEELVLMTSVGSINDRSGPIDAYHEMIDGGRHDMLVEPITVLTDLQLSVMRRHDPELDVPTEYQVDFPPLSEQSEKEAAEERDRQASAREKDFKSGVPTTVILSDPALSENYPGLSEHMEAVAEREETARAAAENAPTAPEEDLVSASAVARKIGMSPSTVIALAKAGEISGVKIRGRWKFELAKVWEQIKAMATPEGTDPPAQDSAHPTGLSESDRFGPIYGASTAMREVFAVLELAAPTTMPILIFGETGTGKEGVAAGIHEASGRTGEMVAINCGALSRDPDRAGDVLEDAINRADGGTLFLDELGELAYTAQAAALRALSGASNVRIVSATARDLDEVGFRVDLRMRLGAIEIEIPSLRDRERDVLDLAAMFYATTCGERGLIALESPFTPAATEAMLRYHWPGNVRELRNAVARGVLFACGGPIDRDDLGIGGR